MNNKKLYVITLTSIQDFINDSKNPKELKNSSDFISKVMKSIMGEIKKQGEIIYPNISEEKDWDLIAIGNTIVFITEKIIEIEVLKKEALLNLGDFEKIPIELYGTWIEYDEDNYEDCYSKLMFRLAGQKNNRSRNLFDGKDYKFSDDCKRFLEYENDLKFKKLEEHLISIKSQKKCLNEIEVSTNHLVLGDYLTGKKELKKILEKVEKYVNGIYRENNEEREFLDELIAGKIEYNKDKNEIIINEVDNFNLNNIITDFTIKQEFYDLTIYTKKPSSKYLAIFRLDIDNMGKKIGNMNKVEQKEISSAIINFMDKLYKKLNESEYDTYKKFIYAGGDDLLVLLPVELSFKFIEDVREIFDENEKLEDFTYTQGIFIIGSKNDFSECMRNSVKLMDKAKKYKDGRKNNTVISLVTEGYSTREAYLENKKNGYFSLLKEYFLNFSSDIYQEFDKKFGKIIKKYSEINNNDIQKDKHIFFNEQKRLLIRKTKSDSSMVNKINEILKDILFSDEQFYYDNYINLQSIIRFLNK